MLSRRALLVLGLVNAMAGCGSKAAVHGAGGAGDGGGGPATSSGTGGSALTSTSSGYLPDGGTDASLLPVIPPDCVPDLDAGLGGVQQRFVCPLDGGQVLNCPLEPYPACLGENPPTCPSLAAGCASAQPTCPQQAPRYICPLGSCVQGCDVSPCPTVPCPDNSSLWTCGPGQPSLDKDCTTIMTTDGGPYADRYSVCCPF